MKTLRDRWRVAAQRCTAGSLIATAVAAVAPSHGQGEPRRGAAAPEPITLAAPRTDGPMPLDAALQQRRSLRSFAATPLTRAELSQLLWAAQGRSSADGRRTVPSAGATYPLELIVLAAAAEAVPAGWYRYAAGEHRLLPQRAGDSRAELAAAAVNQVWLRDAPVVIVVAAKAARTAARYGARADRYVAIEAGAAAQNLQLQAVALGLGSTLVGAFDDAAVRRVAELASDEQPLLIVPIGRPAAQTSALPRVCRDTTR